MNAGFYRSAGSHYSVLRKFPRIQGKDCSFRELLDGCRHIDSPTEITETVETRLYIIRDLLMRFHREGLPLKQTAHNTAECDGEPLRAVDHDYST